MDKILLSSTSFMKSFLLQRQNLILTMVADTTEFDNWMGWFCGWIARIGIAVMVFAALMLVSAFFSDSSDGKVKGLQALAAGAMITSIGGAGIVAFS